MKSLFHDGGHHLYRVPGPPRGGLFDHIGLFLEPNLNCLTQCSAVQFSYCLWAVITAWHGMASKSTRAITNPAPGIRRPRLFTYKCAFTILGPASLPSACPCRVSHIILTVSPRLPSSVKRITVVIDGAFTIIIIKFIRHIYMWCCRIDHLVNNASKPSFRELLI
jgi:hypothetical protein